MKAIITGLTQIDTIFATTCADLCTQCDELHAKRRASLSQSLPSDYISRHNWLHPMASLAVKPITRHALLALSELPPSSVPAAPIAPAAPTVLAAWPLDAKWPVFAGHFPGAPVLPGAVLIDWAAQQLSQATGLSFDCAQAKFPRAAQPGDVLQLRITPSATGFAFVISSDEAGAVVVANGVLTARAT